MGAPEPPHSVVSQPSAAIFDTTMFVAGGVAAIRTSARFVAPLRWLGVA
ncbi:MAG TPA: hypothetical protein VF317_11240 [Dermatophilaceae bacterium]